MRLEARSFKPGQTVWCDATGFATNEPLWAWHLPGSEHPLSKTSTEFDEDAEVERLTIWITLGLEGSGDDLYRVSDGHWWSLKGIASYVFEGHEDGMLDNSNAAFLHQSFVAYGPREWPKQVWGDEDDLYELLTVYQLSPEVSCPWCGDGTGNEDTRSECKLCEGDGYLAIGEYWQVAVYGYVEPDEWDEE